MAKETTPIRRRRRDWWAKWWKADFTWDGLAKKPLQGWVVTQGILREEYSGCVYGNPASDSSGPVKGQKATLQDYWRADPVTGKLRTDAEMGDELVLVEGHPVFHVVHLPLNFKDHTPTGKALWLPDKLNEIVNLRLVAATEPVLARNRQKREIWGTDGRAQFQGGVWRGAASHPQGNDKPLSVRYERAAFFPAPSSYMGKLSVDELAAFFFPLTFYRATFCEATTFADAAFLADAIFDNATFLGNANFARTTFLGDANFDRATFSGDANFERATFFRHSDFGSATFSGNVNFWNASFRDSALFSNAQLATTGNFGTQFARAPNFVGARLHPSVSFHGIKISGLEKSGRSAQAVWLLCLGVTIFGVWAYQTFEGSIGGWFGLAALVVGAYMLWVWTVASGFALGVGSEEANNAAALAKISAENRNHLDEARFFRHQLKAQRLDGGVGLFRARPITYWFGRPAEKALGLSYEIISDYGLSFIRPLICLLVVTITSAFLLWAWEGGGLNNSDPNQRGAFWESRSVSPRDLLSDPQFLEAMSYSASRAFPFGPWGEIAMPRGLETGDDVRANSEAMECAFAARLLAVGLCRPSGLDLTDETQLEGHRLAVRLMGLGQSLLTIVLAFLFALAVRRRFQIS